jgi:flavodoxin
MNVLVIYYSKFGNTKQVAETIAEVLQSAGSVRVMSLDQVTVQDLSNIDLLVAGSPTHVSKLPEDFRSILKSLPKRVLKRVPAAAFDTSYKMNWFISLFTAAKPLNSKLRRLGGKPIVPPKTFLVVDKQGPLYEGEIENAKNWAKEILAYFTNR